MTNAEICKEIAKAKQSLLNELGRHDLLRFTHATMQNFYPADFHYRYYKYLTEFALGKIKKLMVFMPPQHGKSEGSTRRLPAFILGRNPDTKVAIVSYSAPKARKFNREIQRIIDTQEYHDIFPNTTLNSANVTTTARGYVRNADECEIVGHRGGFKTVGVGGALTGDPVDILIMDDLYKDAKSAWSSVVRESISDWYDTVAETRLHNDSQQLVVFTRWHEDDLAGMLMRKQGVYDAISNPNGWVVVTYPAIKIGEPTEEDPRQDGQPLWKERHGLAKLEEVRKRNPHVFESLYQQNPQPAEGLMYEHFNSYDTLPIGKFVRKAYIDTADTGSDSLCAIFYNEYTTGCYVTDILFTNKPMEFTEQETVRKIMANNTEMCVIESNNGGRGFRRNVERILRENGNIRTRFKDHTQTANKQTRIFVHSSEVQNMLYFPRDWESRYPSYYTAMASYRKEGGNAHDDAPDATTGVVEMFGNVKPIDLNRIATMINR